jgi:hypothetical protein
MSQVKSKSSRSYTRHSADYKKEALRLAEASRGIESGI